MGGTTAADAVVKGNLTRVVPGIAVGVARITFTEKAISKVERVIVDSHTHLPDMFEITFLDDPGTIMTLTRIAIGELITINGATVAGSKPQDIMTGEVTSIEGEFAEEGCRTVVRGYSMDHRLQRARHTRAFVNMKLSDIARKLATDAGLTIGTIEQTRTAHDHLGQLNQTDWEFLTGRARAIGYDLGVVDGKFYFRKAASAAAAGTAVTLTYPKQLRRFSPRLTAGNLAAETEVRVWDPIAATAVASTAPVESGGAKLNGNSAASVAGLFGAPKRAATSAAPRTGAGANYGPPPSEHACVLPDRPLAIGSAARVVADEAAGGASSHVGDTFAEATGEALGDPALRAGAAVEISGVSDVFSGRWVITRARHVFDSVTYHTSFEVSGRQERSLLGLVRAGGGYRPRTSIEGVVCGIVTNNNDPLKKARVKVTLPWLSPQYETDWCPVVQAGAGKRSGAMVLPEPGDEVLVGFEFGDPQRGYVLGGLVNNQSAYRLGGEPIKAQGQTGTVVWRGFVSASGNRLAFHDEMPPGDGKRPPIASDLILGTGDGALSLAIDQTAGTVTLNCDPKAPASKARAGSVTVACGPQGTIDIKTGVGGTVNIDGGERLNLTAKAAVKIESAGVVEIKGKAIKLN